MADVKTALKIIGVIGLIIAVVVSIFGFIALKDAREFRDKMPAEPNLFLFVEDGKILAGVKNLMHQSMPLAVTAEETAEYQELLDSKDYEGLLGRNYKIFIVYPAAFDGLSEDIIGDTGYTRDIIMDSLRKDNVRDIFIERALSMQDIPETFMESARKQIEEAVPPEEDIRTMFFTLLFAAASDQQGPTFMIIEYKKGNIDIYPETAVFRFINFVPMSTIEKLASANAS